MFFQVITTPHHTCRNLKKMVDASPRYGPKGISDKTSNSVHILVMV